MGAKHLNLYLTFRWRNGSCHQLGTIHKRLFFFFKFVLLFETITFHFNDSIPTNQNQKQKPKGSIQINSINFCHNNKKNIFVKKNEN